MSAADDNARGGTSVTYSVTLDAGWQALLERVAEARAQQSPAPAGHMPGAAADAFALGVLELARVHGLDVGAIVGTTTVDRFEARLTGDSPG